MINEVISTTTDRMQKAIEALRKQMASLRAGHATPALVEHIRVEYYGTPTPLNQLATISTPEARLLIIQPWERTILPDVEKAIHKSDLGLNPTNDGSIIRLVIPPLTEERRKEFVKLAKNKAEQCRVSIRNIRRDANEQIKKLQKTTDLSEDDAKRGMDEIQKVTDGAIADVNSLLEEKEKEILEF